MSTYSSTSAADVCAVPEMPKDNETPPSTTTTKMSPTASTSAAVTATAPPSREQRGYEQQEHDAHANAATKSEHTHGS